MPYIDITTMRGMMPRVVTSMLPDHSAVLAEDCHFRFGVITPERQISGVEKTFTIKPKTIFHYRDDFWFAWPDVVDVIRSPVAQDNYGRIYYTDGRFPKVTDATIATKGDGNHPASSYRLGIPAPTTAPVCTVQQGGDVSDDNPNDDETRFYTETFVSDYGEEGPPGPASLEVTLRTPGTAVQLTLSPVPLQNASIKRRRIYRSASGGGEADFLLVAELDASVLSYTDKIPGKNLGPSLATWDYLPPPENMTGLCLMANGIAAGFAGNEVMFSEAYLPYAWPEVNRHTTAEDIVAICPLGTSLVVATKGEPYLFSGVSPSTISGSRIPSMQACLSRRSMVAMEGFVLYAGTNGLVSVDVNGNTALATEKIISPEQWQSQFNPASIVAYSWRGEYIACYTKPDGKQDVFVFSPVNMDIRYLSTPFDCAWVDLAKDMMRVVTGDKMSVLAGGSLPSTIRWHSKIFSLPERTSFSCIRVKSPAPERVGITIMADDVPVIHFAPGTFKGSVVRLPAATGQNWQVMVSGFGQVERITLSTSMSEMPV
ncbi:hypothetical protein AML26_08445 [Escherichia coli]|uniref:hypothetical protein n=1 Tax=Escherichia coli TaxID=562 RepID=UPI0007A0A187|nr:hypothetical protein [Escherichia coli]EKT7175419.1 hypothetical protein [Escherichia coli]EME6063088.1 hypothetical protein [Escherichia coli]KYS51689.1 hypothetical protein AML26_08445 [Escherichia coli]